MDEEDRAAPWVPRLHNVEPDATATGNSMALHGSPPVSTLAELDDQRSNDLATLGSKDVVSAARRGGVHHLESDLRIGERARESGMREADRRAGADEHDLGSVT